MATINVNVVRGELYKEIPFNLLSNASGHGVEFVTADTQPSETIKGHALKGYETLNISEFPVGTKVWFRSMNQYEAILAVDL